MKLGSLFSGGGLGDFGFMAAGIEISWQCEIDQYCQKILALRYPESKKYYDIKEIKGQALEPVDIITGGFPCQPFSYAGKRQGKEDNRYLWPEMLRVIKECRPSWVVGENVPGIINVALDTVCTDLETEGYEVWPVVFPSHALGAWHKRDRLWIVAHCRHNGRSAEFGKQQKERAKEFNSSRTGDVANSLCQGQFCRTNEQGKKCEKIGRYISRQQSQASSFDWQEYWRIEPSVGRMANGIADRVHRLKMLGNGQVPACTYVIGKMIMDIEENNK